MNVDTFAKFEDEFLNISILKYCIQILANSWILRRIGDCCPTFKYLKTKALFYYFNF